MKFNKLSGTGVVGNDRQTGQSLGQALEYIGKALQHPGQEVVIRDHFGTRAADMCLVDGVKKVITKLELRLLTINPIRHTIKYSLYSDVDEPDTVLYNGAFYRKDDRERVLLHGAPYVKA